MATTYENTGLGVKFDLPERVTVRQRLAFYSLLSSNGADDWFEGIWRATLTLVSNWQCEKFPNPKVDLGEVHGQDITNIAVWVGTQGLAHMGRAEAVDPKLSEPS